MSNVVLGYGKLGKEIVSQTGWDYISREKDKFDFVDIDSYITKIYKYNTIINCIGNTKTYSIERESHWNINFLGVIRLVDYCNQTKRKLVHVSTDYIYSGSLPSAEEDDIPVHSRNWYAYTKLLADGYIQAVSKNYLLIRTSFKPSPFPYDVAITSQIGNFCYVDEIAKLIVELINRNASGVFNVGSKEPRTIYELAVRTKPDVIPIDKTLHVTMPTDITMSCKKLYNFLGDEL